MLLDWRPRRHGRAVVRGIQRALVQEQDGVAFSLGSLTEFPAEIGQLEKLWHLGIYDNPISDLPPGLRGRSFVDEELPFALGGVSRHLRRKQQPDP
jgi:hypothetical protein